MSDADETEHLIRQAAHEIGINRDGNNPISITLTNGAHVVEYRSRQGQRVSVTIDHGARYRELCRSMRDAWRG